jgi:hypothetical protein
LTDINLAVAHQNWSISSHAANQSIHVGETKSHTKPS